MVPTGLTAWLIYQGSAEVIVGSQTLRAHPGEWLIPRPIPRLQRFSADIQLLSLNFYAQWPTGESLFADGLGLVLDASRHPQLERCGLAVDRALERVAPGHDYRVFTHDMSLDAYLQVHRLFAEFFAALVDALAAHDIEPSPPGRVDPRLAEAVELIHHHPLDRPLVIAQLAATVGLSPVHLNRLAVSNLGHTLIQHWEYRRAEYARRCLAVPGTQIKQVALSLGFSTLGHFSRWFNRLHGQSPRVYRAQLATG